MTLPVTDPSGERPKARQPEEAAVLREMGPRSGTGFRVEPRSSIPARTAPAPRTEVAPRTGVSSRTPPKGDGGEPAEGAAPEPPM